MGSWREDVITSLKSLLKIYRSGERELLNAAVRASDVHVKTFLVYHWQQLAKQDHEILSKIQAQGWSEELEPTLHYDDTLRVEPASHADAQLAACERWVQECMNSYQTLLRPSFPADVRILLEKHQSSWREFLKQVTDFRQKTTPVAA